MKNFCLIYEYNNKKFMNIDKIIDFKINLEIVEQNGKNVKLLFFGDAPKGELAAFMSYFNSLVEEKICDIAISSKTRELVEANDLNNKSIKLSAQSALDIRNKKFDSIVKDYYKKQLELKAFDSENWETDVLNLIGG